MSSEDEMMLVERWRRHKISQPVWGNSQSMMRCDRRSIGSTDSENFHRDHYQLPLPSIIPPDFDRDEGSPPPNYPDSNNSNHPSPSSNSDSSYFLPNYDHVVGDDFGRGYHHHQQNWSDGQSQVPRPKVYNQDLFSTSFEDNHPYPYNRPYLSPKFSSDSAKPEKRLNTVPTNLKRRSDPNLVGGVKEVFKCQIKKCNTTFSNHQTFKKHLERHGKDGNKNKFFCQYCQNSFGSKYDKTRHERIHTGERPYPCPKCHETFARSDALRRHIDRAVNGKSEVCVAYSPPFPTKSAVVPVDSP